MELSAFFFNPQLQITMKTLPNDLHIFAFTNSGNKSDVHQTAYSNASPDANVLLLSSGITTECLFGWTSLTASPRLC